MTVTVKIGEDVRNDLNTLKYALFTKNISETLRKLMDRAGYNQAFFERIRRKEQE